VPPCSPEGPPLGGAAPSRAARRYSLISGTAVGGGLLGPLGGEAPASPGSRVGAAASGPLGATTVGSPPVIGVGAAALPPRVGRRIIRRELPPVDDDDPVSVGSIGIDADEPASLELLELAEPLELLEALDDELESLGDMGAGTRVSGVAASPCRRAASTIQTQAPTLEQSG